MRILRILAKVALSLVTLVFLASIGGGMLVAWPVLVPLHWIVSRDAGPKETAWWGMLAGLSMAEALTMTAYIVAGEGVYLAFVFVVTLVGVSVGFLRARSASVAAP